MKAQKRLPGSVLGGGSSPLSEQLYFSKFDRDWVPLQDAECRTPLHCGGFVHRRKYGNYVHER